MPASTNQVQDKYFRSLLLSNIMHSRADCKERGRLTVINRSSKRRLLSWMSSSSVRKSVGILWYPFVQKCVESGLAKIRKSEHAGEHRYNHQRD